MCCPAWPCGKAPIPYTSWNKPTTDYSGITCFTSCVQTVASDKSGLSGMRKLMFSPETFTQSGRLWNLRKSR